MKRYLGLLILVLVLTAASGCTAQQAKPAATTTVLTTTAAATEAPTEAPTAEKTAVPTKVTTAVATHTVSENVTTVVVTAKPSQTPSTKITTIHIINNTFVPSELTVLPGTGITWINDDSITHVVKAIGESKGKFTSSDMVNGAHFIYTFGETPGSYEFGDPAYPEMKGTIIVKKGESVVGAPTQAKATQK